MSNIISNEKNEFHYRMCHDKLLNIISTAMAYHFSMNGKILDEDINKPIYSNLFKTIDILMNAWLMIESNNDEKSILNGLDLDTEESSHTINLNKDTLTVTNYDKEFNNYKKTIKNIPKHVPTGINSKDLLIPYSLICKSELFMSRYIIEKNNDLIIEDCELNKKFVMTQNNLKFNNISINFNPAHEGLYIYTECSEGLYITMDQLYYLEENDINFKDFYNNQQRTDNNFININKNINNNIEKEKRKNVREKIRSKYGYNLDIDILKINKLDFNNYPNLVNYLSLLSSYYGIYYINNDNNYILGSVDIIKHNLIGSKHFKLNQCKFKNDNIKIKNNNIISNEIQYLELNNIKDILYHSGNYKKDVQFKLSTHNNLILTDIIYNNSNATIYELLHEFGNQADKDYLKLWNNFNDLFKKCLILNDYDFKDFNKLIKIKKDNINYEYKSNFRDLINVIKPNINYICFSYVMKKIKEFYEDIEIPIYSDNSNDKKYENNFPNKFRGNNNYNKLFKQRIGKNYNFYEQLINDKILSNG